MSRLKPLTYGLMHFCVAVGVAFALTGSWAVALGIGFIEPCVQTVFYVLHEKAWDHRRGRAIRTPPPDRLLPSLA